MLILYFLELYLMVVSQLMNLSDMSQEDIADFDNE